MESVVNNRNGKVKNESQFVFIAFSVIKLKKRERERGRKRRQKEETDFTEDRRRTDPPLGVNVELGEKTKEEVCGGLGGKKIKIGRQRLCCHMVFILQCLSPH